MGQNRNKEGMGYSFKFSLLVYAVFYLIFIQSVKVTSTDDVRQIFHNRKLKLSTQAEVIIEKKSKRKTINIRNKNSKNMKKNNYKNKNNKNNKNNIKNKGNKNNKNSKNKSSKNNKNNIKNKDKKNNKSNK